jgi:hypothetical protein
MSSGQTEFNLYNIALKVVALKYEDSQFIAIIKQIIFQHLTLKVIYELRSKVCTAYGD